MEEEVKRLSSVYGLSLTLKLHVVDTSEAVGTLDSLRRIKNIIKVGYVFIPQGKFSPVTLKEEMRKEEELFSL